jgi:hypothetical protein
MRAIIFFTSLLLVVIACSKSTDTPKVYTNAKGTSITFTTDAWSAAKTSAGIGTVNLKIAGSTNGERVTITTYGDLSSGLISDDIVKLDSKSNFDESVLISSKSTDVSTTIAFKASTDIKVYRGSDVFIVTLSSGNLTY